MTAAPAPAVPPSPDPPAPLAIRRARLMLGLTQAQAGALIYRTVRTWNNFESGRRPMDPLLWEVWRAHAVKLERKMPPRVEL